MIVISQPRYLPALNYLHRLVFADIFIVLDNVQRQARGWENRNKLLLNDPKWLTIPIKSSSREAIKNTQINGVNWISEHKKCIEYHYRDAPFYDSSLLDHYFCDFSMNIGANESLDFTDTMIRSLTNISEILSIPFNISKASILTPDSACTGPEKLLELCRITNAKTYVSGPNGRSYGVDACFSSSGIQVIYHEYEHLKYSQFNSQLGFFPYMGFFDALFNIGSKKLVEHLKRKPIFSY